MRGILIAILAGCGAPTKPPPATTTTTAPPPKREAPVKKITDLERAPIPPILNIDWAQAKVDTDADALALWTRIAPTGADWEDKLEEIPERFERPLALALLGGGNFTCMPAPPAKQDCVPRHFDVRDPSHAEGFRDPCLRRLLALWAIDKVERADLPALRDVLRSIVALPLPESELVASVFIAIPEDDHATRLDLLARAWRAGQHDVVNGAVGKLDEAHLIEAATKHHIDGALEILSADGHRAAYLAAVTDEQMTTKGRTRAMFDLVATTPVDTGKVAADIKTALVKAATSKDCMVAATAARMLDEAGDARFVPTRPRARTNNQAAVDKMMRALCVLASYESQQRADEPSLLAGYVPKKGLERFAITYDPLGDSDPDGDGDPHTARTMDLVTKDQLVLPEIDDLILAFKNCAGTTCKSNDREWRFTFKAIGGQMLLTRIEMAERPPCPKP